jgi:hypothetical protein
MGIILASDQHKVMAHTKTTVRVLTRNGQASNSEAVSAKINRSRALREEAATLQKMGRCSCELVIHYH